MIHGLLGQGLDFLGSSTGQSILGAAGQLFKVKELGWVPGAKPSGSVGAPPPLVQPALVGHTPADRLRLPPDLGFPPMGGPIFASPDGAPLGTVGAAGAARSNPFGGRFVELAGAALDRARAFEQLPVQGLDVISLGQADDRELAKLVAKSGVVPADSDLGQLAEMAGAKVSVRAVKMSDGTTIKMRVVSFSGVKKRRRRNYNTTAGRRNAARTLRQMGQQLRTYKRLASLGQKIHTQMNPKRGACAPKCAPKRSRACA